MLTFKHNRQISSRLIETKGFNDRIHTKQQMIQKFGIGGAEG